MAVNPFVGTEMEDSWQQGFSAGFLDTDDTPQPPSPLNEDQREAFSQGVLAGQVSHLGVVIPPSGASDDPETWKEIAHGADIAAELGHAVVQIVRTPAAAVASVGEASLGIFLSVAIWGPERPPFFEEAAAEAVARVRGQLRDADVIADDIELFMAACNRTDHGISAQDELTSQGWFHGRVFLDFDQALAEAVAHVHPDDTRVLRFQSAAPDTIDVIDLTASA